MTIPTLPDPPLRSDPANFAARGDAFYRALVLFAAAANNDTLNIAAVQTAVAASVSAALWVSGTTYAIGDRRFSPATGLLYRRKTAGAGTTDPSADGTNWSLVSLGLPPSVSVTGTSVTGAAGTRYVMNNVSASTFTFPAAPADNDFVIVCWANGRVDNMLNGNGNNVMVPGQTTLLVDMPYHAAIWSYNSANATWGPFA